MFDFYRQALLRSSCSYGGFEFFYFSSSELVEQLLKGRIALILLRTECKVADL